MTGDIQPPVSLVALEVCNLVAVGKSVQAACKQLGVGHETFYAEMRENERLEAEYVRARAARADARFESIDGIMDSMVKGEIDPVTAKVMLDAIKWQCGKEKSKVYGDSTTIRGDKDNPLTLQALSTTLDDRVKGRLDKPQE